MYRRVVIKRKSQKGPRRVIDTFIGRKTQHPESVFEIIIQKINVEIVRRSVSKLGTIQGTTRSCLYQRRIY